MWKTILCCCILSRASTWAFIPLEPESPNDEGIRIDLYRMKRPHQVALNTESIPELGLHLDWLKPKPKPHPNKFDNISVALWRFFDTEYYGVVKVGSSNKTFNVVYDTAWTTSWIMSSLCPSTTIGCWLHNKYDNSRSSTAKPTDEVYWVEEPNYNLTGSYTYDDINIGGARVNAFKFVEMKSVPYTYILSKADGILGLSLPYGGTKTFMERLVEQGSLKRAIFSMYLSRDKQSNRGGVIMLGAIDKKHIHVKPDRTPEEITYLPIESQSGRNWQFKIGKIGLELEVPRRQVLICTDNCQGFADSGANEIVASKAEVDKIHTTIKASPFYFGRYEVNCDTVNKLPTMYFELNGKLFNLTGPMYTQKITYRSFQVCISCFLADDDPNSKVWTIGGAFLSHFYTIYDIENKQIGFVRAA